MSNIKKITKLTNTKYLNLYELLSTDKNNNSINYYISSRRDIQNLKINTQENTADAVMIYALHKDCGNKIVLIKQYRYPIDTYVYELPAGLIDGNETILDAGRREFFEETGLNFIPIDSDELFSKPYYSSIGMTDESISTIYGYCNGEVSYSNLEDTENLQVILADREEAIRILKHEQVSLQCAFLLQHFINSDLDSPFDFLKIQTKAWYI